MILSHEVKIAVLGYLIISTVILADVKLRISLIRDLVKASVLSLLQLLGVGFVILFLLKFRLSCLGPLLVVFFFLNGSFIAARRLTMKPYGKEVFVSVFISISIVCSIILMSYYAVGIMSLKPNSIVPLGGIVAAGGMRALSLAFTYYQGLLENQREMVMGMLALGVDEGRVFRYLLSDVVRHVTIPNVDVLRAAGIVHIPGVMVGLLVAGVPPVKAAVIQFVILATMVAIHVFVVSLALSLIIRFRGFYLNL